MSFFEFINTWWGIFIVVIAVVLVWSILSITWYKPCFKRFYDFMISLIAIPFFLLILIPIAIVIKIEDKGPVFYCGVRLGKNGKLFKMFKIRSMRVNAPDIRLSDGSTYNSDNDERVTKVGKFLRKTSLDELPQILNIFRGEMSFVGPRPDLPDALGLYEENEKKRLEVRPGITGYNQAYFRNSIVWKERIKNDLIYVEKISLWLDIKILFKTLVSVSSKSNINIVEGGNKNIDELSGGKNENN